MEGYVDTYWKKKLADLKGELEINNFEVFLADSAREGGELALKEIIPKTGAKSISWGGSMTFSATGIYEVLKESKDLEVFDTYDKSISHEDSMELRRKALLTDLFITGTNAVTETGNLVNLDMYGNRVAAITFGPRHVIIFVGRNKIVPDLEAAMERIKGYAAPLNAMRLGKKTPCAGTAFCSECESPDRICNTWVITEKCFPKGRLKIILINQDLGI